MSAKLPTLKEIAKQLNISISTVSRALKDHPGIGLRTKTRVQELASKLNYEPNQTAIYFQQNKTFTIGVILPKLAEAFFSTSITGIEDMAEENDYTVLLGQSHDSEERERKIVESMKKHRVDGLIVSISKDTTRYDHFSSLKNYNIPVVFFDRIPNIPDIHSVACDIVSGTMQALRYLFKKGHRVIGMINGPENLYASQERLQGYRLAIEKQRLKYDPTLIASTDLTTNGTYAAMDQLLSSKRKVTAVVAFNDYVAMDAVQYSLKKNRKINEDISFVSYANLPLSIYTAFPPLASVEQFPYEQGQKAMEIMLGLLRKETSETEKEKYHKIVLQPKLITNAESNSAGGVS